MTLGKCKRNEILIKLEKSNEILQRLPVGIPIIVESSTFVDDMIPGFNWILPLWCERLFREKPKVI